MHTEVSLRKRTRGKHNKKWSTAYAPIVGLRFLINGEIMLSFYREISLFLSLFDLIQSSSAWREKEERFQAGQEKVG